MTTSDDLVEAKSKREISKEIENRIQEIGSVAFEHLCKFVVEHIEAPQGCEVTQRGGDQGLDIIGDVGVSIYRSSFGIEVKHYSGPVGADVVRGLSGALNRNSCGFGAVMTSSEFTGPAIDAARESAGPPVKLVNGNTLVELMIECKVGTKQSDEGYKIDKQFWSQFEKFSGELISSRNVPQADDFDTVEATLKGVSSGANYGPQLVEHLIAETDRDWSRRQADYYALAAESLGFLTEDEGEYDGYTMRKWVLTDSGSKYLTLLDEDAEAAAALRGERIRQLEIIGLVLDKIESTKIDQDVIRELIRENSEVTGSTVGRRAATVRSWLREIDEVKINDDGKTTYDYYPKDLSSAWE